VRYHLQEPIAKRPKLSIVCDVATDLTYTVGEMAARIARSESEVGAITRQLRNWTVPGLISPQGELHQGTGRHRRYDQWQLMQAAILEVLARNFRVDVTGLQKIARRFADARRLGLLKWLSDIDELKHERQFLLVSFDDRGNVVMKQLLEGSADWNRSVHELSFLADVTAIANRVFR
jgi:hypothetical protein